MLVEACLPTREGHHVKGRAGLGTGAACESLVVGVARVANGDKEGFESAAHGDAGAWGPETEGEDAAVLPPEDVVPRERSQRTWLGKKRGEGWKGGAGSEGGVTKTGLEARGPEETSRKTPRSCCRPPERWKGLGLDVRVAVAAAAAGGGGVGVGRVVVVVVAPQKGERKEQSTGKERAMDAVPICGHHSRRPARQIDCHSLGEPTPRKEGGREGGEGRREHDSPGCLHQAWEEGGRPGGRQTPHCQ